MAEERIRILQMLQEQKITVEEAERLLAALASLDEDEAPDTARAHRGHGRHHHHHHDDEPRDRSHRGRSARRRERDDNREHVFARRRIYHPGHGGMVDWTEDFAGDMSDWAENFAGNMSDWAENFTGDMSDWPELAQDWTDDCAHLAGDCEDLAADMRGIMEDFGPLPRGFRFPRSPRPPMSPRIRRRVMMHRGGPEDHHRGRKRHFTPGWDIRASELTAALSLLGHEDVSQGAINKLRRHDVTPEYIRALHDTGLEAATIGELVGLRIFETDPDYLRQMQEHFPGSDLKTIINLSKFGVDPDYVASLYDAGLTGLKPGKVIALSAYNLDPVAVKLAWDEDPDRSPRQIYRDLKAAAAETDGLSGEDIPEFEMEEEPIDEE